MLSKGMEDYDAKAAVVHVDIRNLKRKPERLFISSYPAAQPETVRPWFATFWGVSSDLQLYCTR